MESQRPTDTIERGCARYRDLTCVLHESGAGVFLEIRDVKGVVAEVALTESQDDGKVHLTTFRHWGAGGVTERLVTPL
jgi:hypothetical protein